MSRYAWPCIFTLEVINPHKPYAELIERFSRMKKLKLTLFNRLLKTAGNHRAARKTAGKLLWLELAGVKWYSPAWYWKNASRLIKNLLQTLRIEMQGYREPISHPNPKVVICDEFACVRGFDGECCNGNFSARCQECCFGVKKNEQGEYISAWTDPNGNPTWLELSCRDCKHYEKTCKGIDPKYFPKPEPEPETNFSPENFSFPETYRQS